MYGYSTQTETEDERYYRERLEDLQAQQERQREQAAQAREERQREWKERAAYEARHAYTWPEALRKQAVLFGNETGLDDPTGEFGEPDTYFTDAAAACHRAVALWDEEVAKVEPGIHELREEIKKLEARIAELRAGVATSVANRLEGEADGRSGWTSVVGALREYDEEPESLHRWLWW